MALAGTLLALFVIAWKTPGERFVWSNRNFLMVQLSFLPAALILWLYCLYFFFRYDRRSGSLFWLLLFPFIFAPYYFYVVIWKRSRELENG